MNNNAKAICKIERCNLRIFEKFIFILTETCYPINTIMTLL